ncbi:MAG: MFS transporter [Holophagales bacterium]|nr:MFS transporter [Holophagales bacterium]
MTSPVSPRFDPKRRRAVTFALLLVTALASFESTVVSTAMPTIIGDLHGLSLYSWVFSVYLLTSTISMPLFGRLADLYGRRRVLLVATALFPRWRARLRSRPLDAAAHRGQGAPGPQGGRPHARRAHRHG